MHLLPQLYLASSEHGRSILIIVHRRVIWMRARRQAIHELSLVLKRNLMRECAWLIMLYPGVLHDQGCTLRVCMLENNALAGRALRGRRTRGTSHAAVFEQRPPCAGVWTREATIGLGRGGGRLKKRWQSALHRIERGYPRINSVDGEFGGLEIWLEPGEDS